VIDISCLGCKRSRVQISAARPNLTPNISKTCKTECLHIVQALIPPEGTNKAQKFDMVDDDRGKVTYLIPASCHDATIATVVRSCFRSTHFKN